MFELQGNNFNTYCSVNRYHKGYECEFYLGLIFPFVQALFPTALNLLTCT